MGNASKITSAAGRLTVFSQHQTFPASEISVSGRCVSMHLTSAVALRQPVKLEAANRLWMGEVCACLAEGGQFRIELDATVSIDDVASVDRMAGHFKDPETAPVRKNRQARNPHEETHV